MKMPHHQHCSREIFVPVAVYLSTSSTGGDRLLFHYPYEPRNIHSAPSSSPSSPIKTYKESISGGVRVGVTAADTSVNANSNSEQSSTRAYRYIEDVRRWRRQSESTADYGTRECEPPPPPYLPRLAPTNRGHGEIDSLGILPYNLSGSTLASLFTSLSRVEQQERRIELRIEDTLFVGYPCPLDVFHTEQTVLRFSVVFELHPLATRSVIDIYHQLARNIAFALRNAERLSLYLTHEKDLIQHVFDEVGEQAESEQPSPFDLVLERSTLCREIRAIQESIRIHGQVNIQINGWIPVSFCVPHLSYRFGATGHLYVRPEDVKAAVNNIQPYQGLILLNPEDVKASLMPDSTPTMLRFIKHLSPNKSLRQLAAQTDLTYSHVFQLAANLVYWGKAIIIFPLCETNQYVLVPNLDIILSEEVISDFQAKFSAHNIVEILSEFCQPITVTEIKVLQAAQEQSALVGWLLRHRMIVHLHSYVMLVTDREEGFGDGPNEGSTPTSSARLPAWMAHSDSKLPCLIDENGRRVAEFSSEMNRLQITKSDRSLLETLIEYSSSQGALERLLSLPVVGTREEFARFVKLLPYFDGTNHLEHIMYRENILRSELIGLIDRCRSVLVTTHLPDSRTACFFGL